MPCHGCFINDDPLVFTTTGYGARVIQSPVIDCCPGYKLDARCGALHSSPDDGSVDSLMIRVCLFQQAVGRGKPRAGQAVLQYRVTEQVTAKGGLSEASPASKDVIPAGFPQNDLLGFMRPW